MDVEKTIEFILEHEASFTVKMERVGERLDKLTERVDKLTGKVDQLAEMQANAEQRFERQTLQIRAEFRRAVRLGVEEFRRERVRRREMDERLTASHLLTEQKLQRLIDSLNQPHNGHE